MAEAKTALRSRNWYEIVGTTLTGLTSATEKFNNGTLEDKLEKVRTAPGQMKNASEEAVYTHWCGYGESDPNLILGKDT